MLIHHIQVEPQEKKKTPKGRAKKRIQYTRRFVNVTLTGGKRKVSLFGNPATSGAATDSKTDEPKPNRINNQIWICWNMRGVVSRNTVDDGPSSDIESVRRRTYATSDWIRPSVGEGTHDTNVHGRSLRAFCFSRPMTFCSLNFLGFTSDVTHVTNGRGYARIYPPRKGLDVHARGCICAAIRNHTSEEGMRAALSHLTVSFWSTTPVSTKVVLCYI